ncbi:hypothetical protein NDA16_004729 [Ustilago loliicola]|nr:hypothetical protein NDA16_004729 [Ustilago loliicola]
MITLKSKLIGTAFVFAICSQKANAWPTPMVGGTKVCPNYTKLLPRNTEYRKHCEAETGPDGADPKWPCFTFWNGELVDVKADTSQSGKAPDDFFLIKDGSKKDFTIRDPSKDFTIQWYDGSLEMRYSDYDKGNGCYKISLKHRSNEDLRIWVSAEDSKDRDVDTWKRDDTSTVICKKWAHIHVKHDAKLW